MSMICYLARLSPSQIEVLLEQPEATEHVTMLAYEAIFLTPDPAALSAMPPALQQVHAAMAAQNAAVQAALPGFGPLAPVLDLQKSWHILHYLFTGEIWGGEAPANMLIAGTPLGDDVGYGPARLHDPAETQAIAALLANLHLPTLLSRIDLAVMDKAQIYALPRGPSSAEDEADLRNEVTGYFPLLQAYLAEAAAAGDGILIWVS